MTVVFGGLDSMWVIVLFDLPTDTKKARRQYTLFRKTLLKDGFTMLQYSVYARHSSSIENSRVHSERVKSMLPPEGEVRIIHLTDKQFARIEIYYGAIRRQPEKPSEQLTLF